MIMKKTSLWVLFTIAEGFGTGYRDIMYSCSITEVNKGGEQARSRPFLITPRLR